MTMADTDDARTEPAQAWNRFGQFLQDMAAVGQGMVQRNTELWGKVSSNLRSGSYTADAMTNDMARVMSLGMENLGDLWDVLTRPPEPSRVATTLPTVFLRYFKDNGTWSTPDPVEIRVPLWQRGDLPAEADIYLEGDGKRTDPLRKTLSARRKDRSYRLSVADVGDDLSAGFYAGMVAVRDTPLASLRIVVGNGER